MMRYFFRNSFLLSSFIFFIILTSCSPTKDASFAEEDTLSRVVVTSDETEIVGGVDDPIIDTLNGFYEGEYVAVSQGVDSWYLAQIVAFDGGKTNLRYMDNDTDSKDFVELMKLDTVDIQKNDRVWALFGDGIRFRQGIVKEMEQDSVVVKFEGYNDGKVHFLRLFKDEE
ncbi:hypothetical protein WAF17_01900 [Bernardetia sp. ABR2-2B]|uniref:hypothetical protein n=1 Tax=Bernardetia sp. ABR2-2B TaxID=3127472 RepID=UPI0030D3FBA1